jgi:hypothetical protein
VLGDWRWVENRICVEVLVFLMVCVGRCAIWGLDGIWRGHYLRVLSVLHKVWVRIQI